MSQLVAAISKRPMPYQDLIFSNHRPKIDTMALQAKCYVCNKGLEGGCSLTAKTISDGTVLFCSKHYPKLVKWRW